MIERRTRILLVRYELIKGSLHGCVTLQEDIEMQGRGKIDRLRELRGGLDPCGQSSRKTRLLREVRVRGDAVRLHDRMKRREGVPTYSLGLCTQSGEREGEQSMENAGRLATSEHRGPFEASEERL